MWGKEQRRWVCEMGLLYEGEVCGRNARPIFVTVPRGGVRICQVLLILILILIALGFDKLTTICMGISKE